MYYLASPLLGFFLFLTGLFFGSFLNVLADRLPNDRSILGRSSCDFCHKTLIWKDLIPLVSFAYLRGQCRYCHKKFSIQYPLLELLTGILFAATYLFTIYQIPNIISNNYYLVSIFYFLSMVSIFIVVFFADLRYGIIPDEVIAIGSVLTFIWLILFNQPAIVNHFLAGIGGFLFFLVIFMLTRGRGIGFGDVKLGFLLGLFLGFPGVGLAFYIAFLTGGLTGIILILWKKKRMNSSVAFGPFLIFGTFLSFFFSPILIPKIAALLL